MMTDQPMIGVHLACSDRKHFHRDFGRFLKLRQGNFIYISAAGLGGPDELMDFARQVARQRVFFEIAWPPPVGTTPAFFRTLKRNAGQYFIGVYGRTEWGSLIYWPRSYLKDLRGFPGEDERLDLADMLQGAADMQQAHDRFVNIIRSAVAEDRKTVGNTPITYVDASVMHRYLLEGGMDYASTELLCADPLQMLSAIRGASRGYRKQRWASHIALECYSGYLEEQTRRKRWPISLGLSYLAGAPIIYREGGSFKQRHRDPSAYNGADPHYNHQHDALYNCDYAYYRKKLTGFYAFTKKDSRPCEGPLCRIGIMHGHLDGWSGIWEKNVWGQCKNSSWQYGPPEWGWNFFDMFFRRTAWDDATLCDENNRSGNPPYGQLDIVPTEASLPVLKRYKCLIFLGWNTMTEPLYAKLKSYVRSGGRLLASVAHLNTETRRSAQWKIVHKGKVADMFGADILGPAKATTSGVRFIRDSHTNTYRYPVFDHPSRYSDPEGIGGAVRLAKLRLTTAKPIAVKHRGPKNDPRYPLLIENRCGQGVASLVTSWCYPGDPRMQPFMRIVLQTINLGEQADVWLHGPDTVRYATYRHQQGYRIYLLNTDPDLAARVILHVGESSITTMLRPGQIQVYQHRGRRLDRVGQWI